MDDIDRKILALLGANARATVKQMAKEVALSSPAVAERIRRMEQSGLIEGYTVRLNPDYLEKSIHALISISVAPGERPEFHALLAQQPAVQRSFQVTGTYSHMVEVRCPDIPSLEKLISRLQKMGQTNTQIILAEREGGEAAKGL